MHSSQNEQDSRFYSDFAFVPALEPSNQQEAYDMAAYGFELSERMRIPLMMRLVTRLSHSRAVVECAEEAAAESCAVISCRYRSVGTNARKLQTTLSRAAGAVEAA